MKVFIDASAFVALFEEDDEHYSLARVAWSRLISEDAEFWTSGFIVPETAAVLQRHSGTAAAKAFLQFALPMVNVDWVSPSAYASARSVFLAVDRRDLSLVDCVSFELMREMGIDTAFTFDPHFAEQGFRCLPDPVPATD